LERMTWTSRKPDFTGPLDAVIPRIRTPAVRLLAQGYGAHLFAENGTIPPFRKLDIGLFARALEHLLLCAVTKPDRCIYRIVGEALKSRLGFNPVGRNYFDYVPEIRLDYAQRSIFMVIDQPCGFRAEVEQTYSDGRSILIESVAFPVLSNRAGVDGLVLFCDQTVERLDHLDFHGRENATYLGSNVVRRDLIDLGYGVDEGFEDLVNTA